MGKMKELTTELQELRHCGETLISIADTLTALFSEDNEEAAGSKPAKKSKKQTAEVTEAVPETAAAPEKVYSFTDVRALLADKSRTGHTAAVRELLHKYGAQKLSELAPENYAAVVAEAEVM